MTVPAVVTRSAPMRWAMPKSVSLAWNSGDGSPVGARRMLAGFRSRCTIPCACTTANASAISAASSAVADPEMPSGVEHVPEVGSVDQLHHDETRLIGVGRRQVGIVEGDEARMVHASQQIDLGAATSVVDRRSGSEELHSDESAEIPVPGAVDGGHATSTDDTDQLVSPGEDSPDATLVAGIHHPTIGASRGGFQPVHRAATRE